MTKYILLIVSIFVTAAHAEQSSITEKLNNTASNVCINSHNPPSCEKLFFSTMSYLVANENVYIECSNISAAQRDDTCREAKEIHDFIMSK